MTEPGPVPVAILGAGGYIGQQFGRMLVEHPRFRLELLVGGSRSTGQRIGDLWLHAEDPPSDLGDRRIVSATAGRIARSGIRLAFSGLPSGAAGPFERELSRRGVAVFSNASDLRSAPGAPLLIPEVNPGHLDLLKFRARGTGPIVTNPNCSATGLALALAPIRALLRPRSVHVATYQALSGAGFPGVSSLSITDNVVPFIEDEEMKLATETRSLLGLRRGARIRPWDPPIHAHCARVATREGHLEAVTVEALGRPSRAELIRAWEAFDPLHGRGLPSAPHPPLIFRKEPDRPQPLRDRWAGGPGRARGMAVSIGRLRWEPPILRFFLLVHNAVRGGAGGSILNAELASAEGWIPG